LALLHILGPGNESERELARASEQNKMAEPNPELVEVTDHEERKTGHQCSIFVKGSRKV